MSAREWPEECPLIQTRHSTGCLTWKLNAASGAKADALKAEVTRRWRLASAAEALSRAVDEYLKARHLMTGPLDERLIVAQVNLLNAQQAFEKASKS